MIFILPFAAFAAAYFIAVFAFEYVTALPPCYIYELTGIYCPGCGCTRAVYALIHGDILLSLRQNVSIVMSIIVSLILYIELVFRAFGKRIPSVIRNKYFMWGILIFFFVYTILRNIFPQLAPI